MIKEPLLDKKFLKELFNQINKELYVKIIALDFNENPLEEIQGRISSGGSINIDGNSAVRRSCSFTMITDKTNITEYYWAINSKFKLEIGLQNHTNNNYDSIIWFKQGTYVISSFNQSLSINNCTISITGKDKMCLLNGEMGGNFTTSIELASILEYDNNGEIIKEEYLLLKDIIRNLVHIFGKEPLFNIIINDLEDTAVELLKYIGDSNIYYLRNLNTGVVVDIITDASYQVRVEDGETISISASEQINYYSLSPFINNDNATIVYKIGEEDIKYQVIQLESGQTAGYRITDMTYPSKTLEVKAGNAITTALDSIVKKFSDYEYFYDIYGRFIFQKKKTYLNTAWSPINQDNLKVEIFSDNSETIWEFSDSKLFSAFNNTPNLLNLKNDYIVWGERESVSGEKLPIHMRYSIDKKPEKYVTTGLSDGEESIEYFATEHDWRELIFQMARDYYNNNQKGIEFYSTLIEKNPQFSKGITGYEQYYADMLGFWREIYDEAQWLDGWNLEALASPETMSFWIDFIEEASEFSKQNIQSIGDRTKVVNDPSSTAISFRETIDVLYVKDGDSTQNQENGYTYIQLPDKFDELFVISETQKSLKNELDNLLYNYSYCAESVSITSIPIYHLEPNTKILIQDNQNGIYGQYIINKISIPLQYNGTMSINAIKDIERIY